MKIRRVDGWRTPARDERSLALRAVRGEKERTPDWSEVLFGKRTSTTRTRRGWVRRERNGSFGGKNRNDTENASERLWPALRRRQRQRRFPRQAAARAALAPEVNALVGGSGRLRGMAAAAARCTGGSAARAARGRTKLVLLLLGGGNVKGLSRHGESALKHEQHKKE
jgi:hypothetical protein